MFFIIKLKFIISSVLFALALNSSAQAVTGDESFKISYKSGNPRVRHRSLGVGFEVVADDIEAWREKPSDILAELGEDIDWTKDVENANASGGHVVVAEIVPGEPAELCMTTADASKVTHLKLTGRAMKWGAYGPEDLGLDVFLRKLKNLKVLNLRDLDCEIIYLDRFDNIEKIVLPANCTSARVTGNNKLHDLVFGPRFEAFGYVVYDTNKKSYQAEMTTSFMDLGAMKNFNFPEGVAYIGGFTFGKATQSVTFPSTLKVIEYFGDTFTMPPYAHMQIPALKEIHVNAIIPPIIKEFPFKYEHLKNVTLYVPKGTKPVYMKHLKWRQFGNIVEEDFFVKKSDLEVMLEGKWKMLESHLHDPNGLIKNRQSEKTDWIRIKDGDWEECLTSNKISNTKYYIEGGKIYLPTANGDVSLSVEKINETELVLVMGSPNPKLDFKFTYRYERVLE